MAKVRRRSVAPPREVHINLGESVGSCVWQALRVSAKAIVILHDPLSTGPLIAFQNLSEWVGLREEYWRGFYRGLEARFSSYDDLQRLADRLRKAERVIAWTAAGLDDQLMLAWLPQYFRLLDIDLDKLHIVPFLRRPDTGETIDYLGVIPHAVVRRHPPPRRLTNADLGALDAGWQAVTSPEPTLLLELLLNKVGSDRGLMRSFRRLLRRYPNADTGLAAWDLELLKNVETRGPCSIQVTTGPLRRSYDNGDHVGDHWLFWRLLRLGDESLSHPLVTLVGKCTAVRNTKVYLTDIGRKVLAGKANFVELNGIDDWVGGVHLDSASGKVWYRKGSTLVNA